MLERRNTVFQTMDRRNINRVYSEFNVTAYINGKEFNTIARNLSGTGIQIVQPCKGINMDESCQIQIVDNETSMILQLDARVIWKNYGFIGLSFQQMDGSIKEKLNQLLTMELMKSVAVNGMTALG